MSSRADNFNRAGSVTLNGSTPSDGGAAWTEESAGSIKTDTDGSSGRVVAFDVGGTKAAWLESSATDHDVAGLLVTNTADVGVIARVQDASNFYLWRVRSGGGNVTELYKCVGGSFTLLATGSLTAVSGDTLKISAVGTAITGYVNGAQAASVTDSALSSGTKVGIRIGGYIDDFAATDLSAPAFDASTFPVVCALPPAARRHDVVAY